MLILKLSAKSAFFSFLLDTSKAHDLEEEEEEEEVQLSKEQKSRAY